MRKKTGFIACLGPAFWGGAQYSGGLPIPLGPTLKEQLPEVEEAVRFSGARPSLLRVGAKDGISEKVLTAEAGVFDVFSLPLLRGDPKTALARPYTMVLTEPLARRLFGEGDPIGQVVRYEEKFDCEVTGIVGQPPTSSLLQFSAAALFCHRVQGESGNDGVWLERFSLHDLRAANARCRPGCGSRAHPQYCRGEHGDVSR